MIFASPIFLLIFLPLVLLGYFLTPKSFKNIYLLIASIIFYSWGAPKFIFAILITTTIDFFLASIIDASENERKRKIALVLSIVMNVGFLFYFKYFNFFIENTNHLLSILGTNEIKFIHVILPIGISFYTFESITYLVDVYRKVHKPLKNFWDYQLYILFFPKLIAGPITRYHEIADQITQRFNKDSIDNIIQGFVRFCIGLAKKVLIANSIGHLVDNIFIADELGLTCSYAWLGSFAYTFQIYFDFSGYSDMAIGLAKIFGFDLPENFNNPYNSKSITEFWRRWHMTLGSWMKNYLYIPLGGNQVSSSKRLYFNLFIIFLLSGFWHGASWNFIIWGMFHGFFMVLERIYLLRILQKLPSVISVVYSFLVVNFAWVLFRSDNFERACNYYKVMFKFELNPIVYENDFAFYFLLASLLSFVGLSSFGTKLQSYLYEPKLSVASSSILVILSFVLFTLSLASVIGSNFNPFIYFRF